MALEQADAVDGQRVLDRQRRHGATEEAVPQQCRRDEAEAVARGHHRQRVQRGVGLQLDPRRAEAGRVEDIEDAGARQAARPADDEALSLQLPQPPRPGQRMAGPGDHRQRAGQQVLDRELARRLVARDGADGEVDRALAQQRRERVVQSRVRAQGHLREALAESRHGGRRQQQRRGRRDAVADLAMTLVAQLRHRLPRAPCLGHRGPHVGEEARSRLGQLHAARMSDEQRRPHRLLQPPQGLAQRRLRLAGRTRGRVQAAVLHHGDEVVHLLQGHDAFR